MEPTPTARRGLSEIALAAGLASIACAILHLLTDLGLLGRRFGKRLCRDRKACV